jgi:hypothetical protein
VKRPDDTRADMGLGDRGFTVPQHATPGSALASRLYAAMSVLDVEADDDQVELADVDRPRTRGDCAEGERPCPFVGCRYHLAVDVLDTGSLRITGDLDLEAMRSTCSLDVADQGEHTLLEVGELLNLTRERVRQIEERGRRNAEVLLRRVHVRRDAIPFLTNRTQEL